MVSCPKCGKDITDDAIFCMYCGSSVKTDAASSVEQHIENFARNIEQMGKNLTDSLSKAAHRIKEDSQNHAEHFEDRVDHAFKSMENWYDRTFGVLGPLIASFLFLIILRLVIEMVRITGVEILEMDEITSVLLLYLLPLFGITILSNYTSYFARRSDTFRIFSPLFHSIAVVLILGVVVLMLDTLQYRLQNADLATAARTIEHALPTIFIFVLLIGYVILALTMSKEQKKKP